MYPSVTCHRAKFLNPTPREHETGTPVTRSPRSAKKKTVNVNISQSSTTVTLKVNIFQIKDITVFQSKYRISSTLRGTFFTWRLREDVEKLCRLTKAQKKIFISVTHSTHGTVNTKLATNDTAKYFRC